MRQLLIEHPAASAETKAIVPGVRHDIYSPVHKGLRALMGSTLAAAGRMDADDEAGTAEVLAQVRELIQACRKHLDVEEKFIHSAMELRRPGSSSETAKDHISHLESFGNLARDMQAVEQSPVKERAGLAAKLYRHLALFVAENFEHMHTEETENNRILWSLYSDEEIIAIEQTLVASIPPAQKMASLRWMAPSMTHPERVRLFKGMKLGSPSPEVFEGTMAMIKPYLGSSEWDKLIAAL